MQRSGAARAASAESPSGPDPSRYLELLRTENASVELRGLGAQVAEQLPLDRVYIRLRAAGGGSSERQRKHDEVGGRLDAEGARELRGVLQAHRNIALIGDPGSGKTTFLRFLAQQLARAGLGDAGALDKIGLSRASSLETFPLFLRVERLAAFLRDNPDPSCPDEAPEHVLRYLDFMLRGHRQGLPEGYLRERLLAGGCFVLLDGLDEVASQTLRARMAALIENLVRELPENRYVLTCRTRAWEGRTTLGTGVETFRLSPLDPAQVEQFCSDWSRALFRVPPEAADGVELEKARDYQRELMEAVDANPSGGTFTENPLLLTVLAVVHWNDRKLPEQRAGLYDRAVNYLLESRSAQAGRESTIRLSCLQAIAATMVEHPEGIQRRIGYADAAVAVQDVLACDLHAGQRFVEDETLLSGLLVTRTEGEVEFWHLVFQEYLAAAELAQVDDRWERIKAHLFEDRWSEVLLLLGGCLVRTRGHRGPRDLLKKILTRSDGLADRARAVALASRIRRDVLAFGHDPALGTSFAAMLEETLAVFQAGGEPVEESVRVEVAEALGEVGDPRLEDEDDQRVALAGGTFCMGAQSKDRKAPGYDEAAYGDEAPVHQVEVGPFVAARYPTTVAAYRRFVEAGGYRDPALWPSDGWSWREREGIDEPEDWPGQRRHGNRPVVGVSWYEAVAFARWFGGALPTEAQWEWMARGPRSQRYPWGDDDPTPQHAAFDFRIEHTVPVGCYPEGASAEGLLDLAGNVFEWCADWFADYPAGSVRNPSGPERGRARVLRGGSFDGHSGALRAAFRSDVDPGFRRGGVGFRVVWSPPEDS